MSNSGAMAEGATAAPSATLLEGAEAESSGCGAGGRGADILQQQCKAPQQLGFWAIDSLPQPAMSTSQVVAPIGNPAVSRTANKMVKTLPAACMLRKP
jgi:hypothetical protein